MISVRRVPKASNLRQETNKNRTLSNSSLSARFSTLLMKRWKNSPNLKTNKPRMTSSDKPRRKFWATSNSLLSLSSAKFSKSRSLNTVFLSSSNPSLTTSMPTARTSKLKTAFSISPMKLSSSLLKISEKNTILWTKRKKIQSLKETMRTSRILSNPFSPSLALLLLKNSRSLKPLQRMIISISWNLLIGPTWKAISQGWALCSRILSKEGRIIGKSILVLLMVPKSWRIFRMMMTKCLESKIIRSTRKNRTSRN